MEIDWSKAPEWADWHAIDEDGKGFWFEIKPSIDRVINCWDNKGGGSYDPSGTQNIGGVFSEWKQSLQKRPSLHNKHPHYHKPTNGVETVDVYWVLNAWGVKCHATGHAIKKLLNAGQRGVKPTKQDLEEAIDSIKRAIELI